MHIAMGETIPNPTDAYEISRDEAVALLCFLTDSCFKKDSGGEIELDLADKLINPALHSGSLFPTQSTCGAIGKHDR